MSMHNFVAISGAVCINKGMFMDVMWIIPTIVLIDIILNTGAMFVHTMFFAYKKRSQTHAVESMKDRSSSYKRHPFTTV